MKIIAAKSGRGRIQSLLITILVNSNRSIPKKTRNVFVTLSLKMTIIKTQFA